MLDKDVWSSEMIVVRRGDDMGEMLYNESVNWEDDPPRRTRPPTTSSARRFKSCRRTGFHDGGGRCWRRLNRKELGVITSKPLAAIANKLVDLAPIK